jgi:hypothetical protein
MPVHVMLRAPNAGDKPLPFAQLPHDIAADPRLTPIDVRVVSALLFWARDKPACWPCDRSIAGRVGRSVSTVQRALRRLQALGLVQRDRVPQTDANRTGRILRLRWRVDRRPGHECPTPRSSVTEPPRSPVTDEEGKNKRERERPGSGPGHGSPTRPAGDETGDGPASAEELELWRSWAAGGNHVLAGIGRASLAKAGGACEVGAPPPPDETPPPPSYVAGVQDPRPEGPRNHEPTASEVRGPAVPCAPRPGGAQALGPAASPALRLTIPLHQRPMVSGTSGLSGPRAPGAMSPKVRDAGDLAIPWASVLAGLRDRRLGGSRHPRPQGP